LTNSAKRVSFWSIPTSEMLLELQTTAEGLKSSESDERLKTYGANILRPKKSSDALKILLSQFKSPITLILLFAAGLAFFPPRTDGHHNHHDYYSDKQSAGLLAGERSC
jgi:P-type Mg2+ transporter